MKVVQATLALAAIMGGNAWASNADASPLYIKAAVGQTTNGSVEGINLNDDFAYQGAVGTALGPVRLEGAATHVSGDIASYVSVDGWDYSLRGYLDFPLSDTSGVFVGAGVDHIEGSANLGGYSLDASGNGWSYSAGVAHRFSSNLIGEVSYTHTEADLDSDYGSFSADFDTILAGVRVSL